MKPETKNCQNCKQNFVIETEDFDFYKKIDVPPPTWCPECRQRRRYAWRNERTLYRRSCDLCKKSIVTIYSDNKPYKVYCPSCWWGDEWDSSSCGRDFDFNRPFFEQFRELQLQVPRISLLSKNSINSDYTNHAADNKNCYLCFGIFESENLMYCTNMWDGAKRDSMDCYRVLGPAELTYECLECEDIYNCQFCFLTKGSHGCFYCYDCRGCSDCFLSWNLRNKQYHILNQPYSKEEYYKKIKEFQLNSHASREKLYKEWLDNIKNKALHKYSLVERSMDVSGSVISEGKNSHYVFDADNIENCKYSTLLTGIKDSMDVYHVGLNTELVYEGHGMVRCYNAQFIHLSYDNSNIMYCDMCYNSENLFGCIGVKKGGYQIFNKHYEKGEYESLKAKIISHMKKTGEYGEFFPPQISPIAYNETQGQIYVPMNKSEVLEKGWQWEDRVPGTFGKETTKPNDLPDDISSVSDSILEEILACAQCSKNYRLIEPELVLYRKLNIPIPRLCPNCRYLKRINLRWPRKLWHRKCCCNNTTSQVWKNSEIHFHDKNKCPNKFETPYSPDRSEVVYCEACYNAEVA